MVMCAFRSALFSLAEVWIFSSPDFSCLRRTQRHLLRSAVCVFPAPCVDVQGFHVTLADIFVAQLGVVNSSLSGGKFAIEDVLWDAPIFHPTHVTEPSQPALSEQREHGGKTSALEDLGIGHLVTSMNAGDAAQAAHVEAVQFALLFEVCCPCLAAVEESADHAGIVHCHLCWNCQLWVLPDAGGETC